jgi:hypothetical protein
MRAPQSVASLDRSWAPRPLEPVGAKGVPTDRPRVRRVGQRAVLRRKGLQNDPRLANGRMAPPGVHTSLRISQVWPPVTFLVRQPVTELPEATRHRRGLSRVVPVGTAGEVILLSVHGRRASNAPKVAEQIGTPRSSHPSCGGQSADRRVTYGNGWRREERLDARHPNQRMTLRLQARPRFELPG